MSRIPTFPGVNTEEHSAGARKIIGTSTSNTAFIGRARRGPVDEPVTVSDFSEYVSTFGELWEQSALSYAVYQYFLNGGFQATIIRVFNDGGLNTTAEFTIPEDGSAGSIILEAASPGSWGSALLARVDHDTAEPTNTNLFNLKIMDTTTGRIETHLNVSAASSGSRLITGVLQEESQLVRVRKTGTLRPEITMSPDPGASEFDNKLPALSNALITSTVTDGIELDDVNISGDESTNSSGINAFDRVDSIDLICIPPYDLNISGNVLGGDISPEIRRIALAYAKSRGAVFLVDPPSNWKDSADAISTTSGVDSKLFGIQRDANAALYYPRVKAPDPLKANKPGLFVPSGAIAGLIARTDSQGGIWKAPAGINATLRGVTGLDVSMTETDIGSLNPLGINCLRMITGNGCVVWGARTMRGSDTMTDQWKYLPVRRLAIFIEKSVYHGIQWVVFEPNQELLWSKLRLNIREFMHTLFRQGAFQGSTPEQAFFVKCDSETTTLSDINEGIVNILIGFAPLRPAEFVIIKIQQLVGQVET